MPTVAGKEVWTTGFGLMGFTWRPVQTSHEEAIKVMKKALEHGANCWNAGDFYGTPESNSLHLVKAYFTKYPEDASKVSLNLKSFDISESTKSLDWSTEYGRMPSIRRRVENALKILDGTKSIDIFENARGDPKTDIEETVKALDVLRKEGKIGGIGLSDVNQRTIRRAAAVAPIACVEIELSLWSTEAIENGITQACKELGIPIVAYSPLGKGFLTGQIQKLDDLPEHDLRRSMPRLQPDVFDLNLKLVHELEKFAKNKGCTPPQLALAWIRSLNDSWGTIIPIPGATTIARVDENMTQVDLTADEVKQIDEILANFEVKGARVPSQISHLTDL